MIDQTSPQPCTDRQAETRQIAARLLVERCRLQARQALLEPAIGVPLITIVALTLHPRIAADQLVPWAALLGATLLLRSFCSVRFITRRRHSDSDAEALAGVFNLTSGLSGLLIGACAGLFFAQVEHADRLTLTVIIFAWLALGVLLQAPFPRHALLHGGAVLAQLAVAWALAPDVPGLMISLGVLAYGAMLARLSIVLSSALSQSMKRRHRIRQLARRLDQQRQQAVRSSHTASRFLAAASHDLRQPATSMGLLCALIRERCADPSLAPLVSALDRSATTISELLSSLLDLSRLESGTVQPHFEWITLTELLESLREEFEPRARDKRLTLVVAAAPVLVFSDRILLSRLLRNLLDNAIRFTDEGAITLAASAGETCVISVTDTGVGIAPENLDRIFDEHVRLSTPKRRSPPGLGLGLAMVRRIAAMLDAQVNAHSDGCRGSRFALTLPPDRVAPIDPSAVERPHAERVCGEPAAQPYSAPLCASTGARPTALLVDDDPDVAAALQALLDSRGWDAVLASDAPEAFAHLSSGKAWDLLITDYQLSGTSDGIALALAARLARPDVRCLLMSADTSSELQRRVTDHGLTLMMKPLTESALADAIRNRCDIRPAQPD